MRVADIFLVFPSLILAMTIAPVLGPSLTNTMVATAVVEWQDRAGNIPKVSFAKGLSPDFRRRGTLTSP